MLAGSNFGHIKAMYNERGQKVEEAGPATPALILGLNGAPQAGDKFNVMETDREAKDISQQNEPSCSASRDYVHRNILLLMKLDEGLQLETSRSLM